MSSQRHPLDAYRALVSLAPPLAFARMQAEDLPEVQRIENDVYPFPWTRGNFTDSLANGYHMWVAREGAGGIVGYFLMMPAVDEAHLLNITVRKDKHGQGIGRALLDRASALAREEGMASVLLEVRPSNRRALSIYERYGYVRIGMRRGYYPSFDQTREDAIVMRLLL